MPQVSPFFWLLSLVFCWACIFSTLVLVWWVVCFAKYVFKSPKECKRKTS
nr:ATP8 [Donax semistriatus]